MFLATVCGVCVFYIRSFAWSKQAGYYTQPGEVLAQLHPSAVGYVIKVYRRDDRNGITRKDVA